GLVPPSGASESGDDIEPEVEPEAEPDALDSAPPSAIGWTSSIPRIEAQPARATAGTASQRTRRRMALELPPDQHPAGRHAHRRVGARGPPHEEEGGAGRGEHSAADEEDGGERGLGRRVVVTADPLVVAHVGGLADVAAAVLLVPVL